MEFLLNYALFLAKIITLVAAIIFVLLLAKGTKNESGAIIKGTLKITNLSKNYKDTIENFKTYLHKETFLKAQAKLKKKDKKAQEKREAKDKDSALNSQRESCVFVIDFKGSVDAKEVTSLREEVTAILAVAQKDDEVVVRLESGGGMVHGYGLASSQLARVKDANLQLTITVDKIAASGGYMMACIADKIIAAPFAVVGSIGVIAQLPNFNKVLKKYDVEYEQLTAGEYKRTLTVFGENTDRARKKFKQELEETHILFKNFIAKYRSKLDVDKIATGEHWFALQALELGLIDEISTSDDLLAKLYMNKTVLLVNYAIKKSITDKLSGAVGKTIDNIFLKLLDKNKTTIV